MKVLTSSVQTSYEEIELDLSSPPAIEELKEVLEVGDVWYKRWGYGHHGTWVPGIEKKIVNEVVRHVKLVRNGF